MYETPTADWLDVTYSPDDFSEVSTSVSDLLGEAGFSVAHGSTEGDIAYRSDRSIVRLTRKFRFARVSASGGALVAIRAAGLFMEYLGALAQAPHRVTRLDIALDLPKDAPPILAALHRRYPSECALSHKPQRVSRMLAARPSDGAQTGTLYVGSNKASEVSCRVYDKQWQLLDKFNELIEPRTRYELTLRKGVKPTLKDAAKPSAAFWHYMGGTILKRPPMAPEWVRGDGSFDWVSERPSPALGGVLKARVEASAELGSLIELADRSGSEGRVYLLSLVRSRLGL